ncbi:MULTISPECIES: hypothetical protein [unclassified Saccharothrix]|uniref:hypothetical protein n=1 Tax=unclassified Saccharothrix TaxID=2593673 RepID=UPI00307E9BC7
MEAVVFVAILALVLYLLFRRPRRRTSTAATVLGVVAALAAVAVLAWREIQLWFDRHRAPATLGELVRRELETGHYEVVANVLDRGGTPKHTRTWRTSRLDPEVRRRFGDSDRVVVYTS